MDNGPTTLKIMSRNNGNSSEELARRDNISQFLEGLLEENTIPECSAGNVSTNIQKPDCRKAEVGKIQESKRKNVYLDVGQKPKRARCNCKFAQRRFLPENELRAFRHHSELFKKNENNILKIPFSIHNIKHSDILVQIYTGIPQAKGFFYLAEMFHKERLSYYLGWVVGQLTFKQQLLMTLIKLRLGLTDLHLSMRFNCSLETVTNTVYSWLFAIHERLVCSNFQMYGIMTVTERMILDTINIQTKAPENPHIPHKVPLEHYTALILYTPGGVLTYIGNLYVWICKKLDIIQEKDFQEFLATGDVIVVDRDIFDENPSLPEGVSAMVFDESCEDLKSTREDVIRRLMEYEAIKCVPSELSEYPNVVWRVVALLVNFSYLTRPTK